MLDNAWRPSSYSTQSGVRIEVRESGGLVQVRDSRDGSPVLSFESKVWAEFVAGVAVGAFAVAALTDEWLAASDFGVWAEIPEVCLVDDAVYIRNRVGGDKATLLSTRPEWDAFEAGVEHGEFTASAL